MSMIKISVGNNMNKETVIVDSGSTLRAAIEESGILMGNGLITMDGSMIKVGDLDKTFDDFGLDCDVTHSILAVVKSDNAAKGRVAGGAFIVTSIATPEELKTLGKYRPAALKLIDKETKEPKFIVKAGTGMGDISKNGAIFGEHTDPDGKATITVGLPDGVADGKAWAVENLGGALLSLNEVEKQFADQLASVKADMDAIEASIVVG